MPAVARYPMISIEFQREEIPARTIHPDMVPDDKWRYVDKEGHGHFWDGKKVPTLEWIVTGTEWVGDDYGGDEVEIGEHRCRLCGEVVEPKRKAVYGPGFIPGLATFIVSIDGETFTLTEEQYAESVGEWAKALRKAATMRGR